MSHIFYTYISEENHQFLIDKARQNFPSVFQKGILKYRRWQDAQLSLLGRMLLEHGLKTMNHELYIRDLLYTSYNKPYFEGENITFNISHSGAIVVCAISDKSEVGIDIEIIRDVDIEEFKFQMTELEWRRIISSDTIKSSFFEYWTQKEAVIKANGKGLSTPLKSFEIINNQTKIEGDIFFLKEICLDTQYKCHIALKKERPVLNCKPQLIDPTGL